LYTKGWREFLKAKCDINTNELQTMKSLMQQIGARARQLNQCTSMPYLKYLAYVLEGSEDVYWYEAALDVTCGVEEKAEDLQVRYFGPTKTPRFNKDLRDIPHEKLIGTFWFGEFAGYRLFDAHKLRDVTVTASEVRCTFVYHEGAGADFELMYHNTHPFAASSIVMGGFRESVDAQMKYPDGVYAAIQADDIKSYLHFIQKNSVWAAPCVTRAFESRKRIKCDREFASHRKQVLVKSTDTKVVAVTIILRTLQGMRDLANGCHWNYPDELHGEMKLRAIFEETCGFDIWQNRASVRRALSELSELRDVPSVFVESVNGFWTAHAMEPLPGTAASSNLSAAFSGLTLDRGRAPLGGSAFRY
jgi:hypothetical protein